MSLYNIGVFLGAVTQPSTIIVIILALILSEAKKSLIIIILVITCIVQLLLKAYLGSPSLNIFTLIVTFLAGYLSVSVIYFIKRKNKPEQNENILSKKKQNTNISKYLKKFLKLIVLFLIIYLVIIFVPVIKKFIDINYYHNQLKPKLEGYTKVNYENLKTLDYKGQQIEDTLIQLIHYTNLNNYSEELNINNQPANPVFSECIDYKTYDMECIIKKKQPFFLDETCLWTFNGYSVITSKNDNYLINVNERACGSMVARWNSYYLVRYDGRYFEIKESKLAGRYPQRNIEYYKVTDEKFLFISSICYHGAESCWSQKADWLEFKY